MSTRILHDTDAGRACLYDSVTETAFGPCFLGDGFDDAAAEAEAFMQWIAADTERQGYRKSRGSAGSISWVRDPDPRCQGVAHLIERYATFRREVEAERREGART